MGKLIFKMLLMTGIFVGISNYMLYIMTGKSPFANFKLPSFSLEKKDLSKNISKALNSGKQQAYKWTDSNGVVHYSSEPPTHLATAEDIQQAKAQKQLETLQIDPNTNLIQGTELLEDKEEEQVKSTPQPLQNVYSPGGAQKLMEDAKNVEKLLNDRFEQQKKAIEQY